ncbi:MAG: hypothetical protein ACREUL_11410 [Steroidobacteraceae bacterium]
MNTTTAALPTEVVAPPQGGRIWRQFADHRRRDRNFFLLMVALIWLGILMGFVPEIVGRARAHNPFPAVVYFHGAVFVGWLCLLTVQVLLIRSRRVDLHRELGMAGTALYGAMIVLGITTSVVVDHDLFATPHSDPSFLSIQFADMLAFAVLGGGAIALRKKPDAHKRLIILATICIADAGFSRWWAPGLAKILGDGYWGNWAQLYLSDFLLITMLGTYDLISRRRLYSAYIFGAAWGLGLEFAAVWMYLSPWWKPVATVLIGR